MQRKKTKRLMERLLLTMLITCAYCGMWMGIEYFFFGGVVNRDVDNIMMVLFIPVIFLATEPLVRWFDKVIIAMNNRGTNPLCFDCVHFKTKCDGFQDDLEQTQRTHCRFKKII